MKKRLTMMVVALITLCGAAADDFYGKVSTMAKVDAMAAGQWYALYNGSKFICDAGDGTLTTSTTPALNLAQNYTGCFMQVDGDNLVSGYGNTVGLAADYASGYTIYQVTLQDEADLSASQRLTFDSKMIKAGCLARFYCKRNVARYLTSTESGTAKGAAKTSNTDKSQIWLVTCTSSNDGSYTLLNASTGEYLTSDYDCPGSETTLYIQQSPNNGSDDYYYNISSSSAFSGSTCLNLGNDGSTLYEWSYSNDAGCDWAIEIVYEMTEDEVMDELRGNVTYASELTSGKYYQVISYAYSKYMAETGGQVKCMSEDVENFAQYWQLTKSGNGWTFRNVMTDNYIQKQNTTYSLYYTGTAEQAFYLTSATEGLNTIWYLNNEQNGSRGMHCDASSNVVPWTTTGVDASKWLFQEVELTAEDIAAAKESYADYQSLVSNLSTIQGHLDNLFADKACTQLLVSADALATNEDYLALPEAIQAQVAKVANDTWGLVASDGTSYEKAFRIASYQPYSHYTKMAGSDYTAQSNSYGKLSGPTGIYANSSDVLFIYVDQDPDIYCTLQAELVMTDGNAGDHQTGTTTSLTKGLNIIQASEQDVVYIFYQLNDPDKYLANYPDITIHIEGGEVNGMMDVTRGMTNTDWANMKSLGLLECCPVLNLKTEHLVFAMTSDLVTAAMTAAAKSNGDSVEDAEKLLRIWETIVANEERYQGLDDFDGRLRNIWNVFTVDYNYMYASTYGTYYNESTIPSIMNYYNMTHQGEGNEGGNLWGPSHEIGHNHQNTIKLIGTTESSNNMFSNINQFEQGVSTTRYSSPVLNFDSYLAEGLAWNERDISVTTRMYFQLYLYYHVMGHDTEFLPKLFKALRSDPLVKNGSNSKGSQDYLHFAKKVCDIAQADLSEFFEAYGMFVPVDNYYVSDYAEYYVTTTAADIKSAKAYMQKYEKKLGNIMFIDDHIEAKLADPDNIFEAVPASDGYKVNCCTYTGSKVGTAGTMGDYESYDGHTAYDTNNDYYTISGNTITFKGSGMMGHKVYDLDGNLIWACNKSSATIPTAIKSMFPDEVVIVGAEQNMNDVPCPYYKKGSYPVYGLQVSFADGVSQKWWADGGIDDYLPANAVAVVVTSDAPEALLASTNVVNTDGTAQSIVIDGDQALYLTTDVTAASVTFAKSGDGYQALCLPFAVTDAQTLDGTSIVTAATVAAGSPVVVSGDVAYTLANATLTAGEYKAAESGYTLNADGTAVTAAALTPFAYDFGHAFEIGGVDALTTIQAAPATPMYDLSGRRAASITKPGLYITNGRKVLVK